MGSTRRGPGRAGQGIAGQGGWQARLGSDTGREGRCVHGKVNMVPSRRTCIAPRSRVRGSGAWGLQERACDLCVHEATPGQMPHRPALGTRGSARLRRAMLGNPPAVIRPDQGRALQTPARTGSWFFSLPRQRGPGRGNARARHRPLSHPHAPTRPGEARPQDSGSGCQGDIFSGTARFQRPPPAQLAGSLSTFLQTGSLAVTGCQAARGLGESSAYGGALAGASGPGALSCSNPARLTTGWALPFLA